MTGRTASFDDVLLALADDELCMGHRHSEWMGLGPFLEEDLAFISIAQDEIGHARALFGLLGEARGTSADDLAFRRTATDYRSCALVEDPCSEWSDAFIRHCLYDMAEQVRWATLASSGAPEVAELATKVLIEEAYHIEHALPLLERLLAGGDESHGRIATSLDRLIPLAGGLFESPTGDGESEALASGELASSFDDQYQRFQEALAPVLTKGSYVPHWPSRPTGQGRSGIRSTHFGDLHAEMTHVYALDPAATW